jgi:hypothetical protein
MDAGLILQVTRENVSERCPCICHAQVAWLQKKLKETKARHDEQVTVLVELMNTSHLEKATSMEREANAKQELTDLQIQLHVAEVRYAEQSQRDRDTIQNNAVASTLLASKYLLLQNQWDDTLSDLEHWLSQFHNADEDPKVSGTETQTSDTTFLDLVSRELDEATGPGEERHRKRTNQELRFAAGIGHDSPSVPTENIHPLSEELECEKSCPRQTALVFQGINSPCRKRRRIGTFCVSCGGPH